MSKKKIGVKIAAFITILGFVAATVLPFLV